MGILWKEKLWKKRNTSVQHRIPLMKPACFLLFFQGKVESVALAGVPEKCWFLQKCKKPLWQQWALLNSASGEHFLDGQREGTHSPPPANLVTWQKCCGGQRMRKAGSGQEGSLLPANRDQMCPDPKTTSEELQGERRTKESSGISRKAWGFGNDTLSPRLHFSDSHD